MLVCYSPFFLLFLATCFDIDKKSKFEELACKSINDKNCIPVCLENPIFIGLFDDHDCSQDYTNQSDIGYLGRFEIHICDSCMSCLGTFARCFEHLCQPRIKRFSFVFISPICIYMEALIFYRLQWTNNVEELNKNEILFGLTSIIGGINSTECLPPTGPFYALVTYWVLGSIILVLPKDFEKSVISVDENTSGRCISSILKSLNVLSPSRLNVYRRGGFTFLQRVLSTCTFLPLNPAYWLSVKNRPTTLVCRIVFILVFFPFIMLPIVLFSILMLYGWMNYIWQKMKTSRTVS